MRWLDPKMATKVKRSRSTVHMHATDEQRQNEKYLNSKRAYLTVHFSKTVDVKGLRHILKNGKP